jgi:arylsulfatase A-like enzyme
LAKLELAGLLVVDRRGEILSSWWTPFVFTFQDVWVATLYASFEAGASFLGERLGKLRALLTQVIPWSVYAVVAAYTAINVPVARVFSTPLTYALVAATGGALSDSIRLYLTPLNIASVLLPLVFAALAPRLLQRVEPRFAVVIAAMLALLALLLGPMGTKRIESRGLHRNAVASIVLSIWSRRAGAGVAGSDGNAVPLPFEGEALDLSGLRGRAAGHNVIWVILESTGAAYLKPYGADRDPMPHLTRLAERGVVFENVYSAYPESIKGLFSILCSSYPAAHTAPDRYAQAAFGVPSVATRFQEAGWRTGLFHSGRFVYLGMSFIVEGRGFERLEDAATIGGEYASSFGTDDASTARRVLAFIDASPRDAPFFAMYMPISGHHPYHSPGIGPRPFSEASERDRYLNDLYAGDDALGSIVEGIRARGLEDKTTWIIIGDHGEAFLQHDGNFAHSLYIYEENVHVPFIAVIPGATAREVRAPQVGSLVDVAPTLLEFAGLTVPGSWQGRSLLASPPAGARFFTDYTLFQVGLRHSKWKFIHEVESTRSLLFDITTDPAEQHDLSARMPARVKLYENHLAAWAAAQRGRVAGTELVGR